MIIANLCFYYTPRPTKLEGGGGVYWIHLACPSVRPSFRPSVCRRHGFRSISQVCFGMSISNFICMLMVAIGRSLLIFSDVTFKMAAWRPYWIFIPPVSEGSGDVMVLRRSRPPSAARHPPPAARNGVNAITQKPLDGLFSNLVYTLVVIVSWPD